MTFAFDPLVPRPVDRYTPVPLEPLSADDLDRMDDAKIFGAPDDPADWPRWRAQLAGWRTASRERHHYRGTAYDHPRSQWASRCHVIAQVWLWDELLYDFAAHRFTPERFLADAGRFGGLDAIVLWHAYPVIGIDDRNQWDYYRDIPGLRELVKTLHDAGVYVFVDYNPWDTGTRRAGSDLAELSALVAELKVDGVFLDTLKEGAPELVAALEEARPGLVLEGESKLPVTRIEDHVSSWAQFFADTPVPGVLRAHWYERRHMQHHVRRWHRDHSEELQSAWINGVGIMVWEVVFGSWVGWSHRDAATARRMVTVQRAATELLVAGEWTPLAPLRAEAHAAGVYASVFELDGVMLWTLVNRSNEDYNGPIFAGDLPAGTLVDLLGCTQREFWTTTTPGDRSRVRVDLEPADTVGVRIPARGIAAVVHVAADVPEPAWVASVLAVQGLAHEEDSSFPHRVTRRTHHAHSRNAGPGPGPGRDAVVVPAGDHVLTVRYRARETGMYQGAPYVNEWKPLEPRLHDARVVQREVSLTVPVAIDAVEVTNAEFAAFCEATGYVPAVANRFLAHWIDGHPVPGTGDQPVTYVDLDDARAYCTWRGGRLPTEDEWQIAAERQGLRRGDPLVWNWTSELSDGRTRFVMLKGGCHYRAVGSDWYLQGGEHEPDYTAKLLVLGLGLARGSTVGFRCAWDLPADTDTDTKEWTVR